jgi:hypothetical protein
MLKNSRIQILFLLETEELVTEVWDPARARLRQHLPFQNIEAVYPNCASSNLNSTIITNSYACGMGTFSIMIRTSGANTSSFYKCQNLALLRGAPPQLSWLRNKIPIIKTVTTRVIYSRCLHIEKLVQLYSTLGIQEMRFIFLSHFEVRYPCCVSQVT